MTVLIGWVLNFSPLQTVLPGLVAMKANTAVSFCLAATSLLLFLRKNTGFGKAVSYLLAGTVVAIAALSLLEYVCGFNVGIDELLFRDHVRSSAPGRMSPISGFNFVCLGLALTLLHFPRRIMLAQALVVGAAATSLLAVIGYVYGVESLYQAGNFTAVALHTALAFLVLSSGILCATTDFGFMRLVSGPRTSGKLLRRYGIAAVVLPVLFGYLRLEGERLGWCGVELGTAVFAIVNVGTFAALIWVGARSLQAAEGLQVSAQEKLAEAHRDLERRVLERTAQLADANADLQQQIRERTRVEQVNTQIMDNSLDVICTISGEGNFLQVSRASEVVWGYRPEELVGRMFIDFVHPEDREKTLAADASILGGKPENDFENRYVRRDGSVVPILWTAVWSEAEQTTFCVARDMTGRKKVEHELLRAKEIAEAANRTKDEFLANMSHEIRTPMNGIIGMTELVLETPLNREQREYLDMAKSSAHALLSLISDILDFSKIEAGMLEMESISFSLRETLAAMLRPLGVRAAQKGLELTIEIPGWVPDHLKGDPLRLRQILTNLTDNAIKFTESGDVMLRVDTETLEGADSLLHFSVVDTGIGIPYEKQALIFEAFAQADGTTTRQYGGTGLGLAIATRLVRQMGGRVWVESAQGEGAAFHFTALLPAVSTPIPGVRLADASSLKGLRALVVDDNAVNRRILREMLLHWQMVPIVVASGPEALGEIRHAVLSGSPFPLIVLDGMMPGMDGFEVVEQIRASAEHSGATVMMLSSAMPVGAATRCEQLGVASFLMKPVSQAELFHAILIALGAGAETEARITELPPLPIPSGLRILLAEDNAVNRALATGILQKRGHSLIHAANGTEAVDAALSGNLDLILMDVQMPEMDGLEATRRIREFERVSGRHIPIAAMTAHAMSGDRERCLAAGTDYYISKPLRKAELLAILAEIPVGCLAPSA